MPEHVDVEQPKRRIYYVSPTGTVEILSPEALEADKETTDELNELLNGEA